MLQDWQTLLGSYDTMAEQSRSQRMLNFIGRENPSRFETKAT